MPPLPSPTFVGTPYDDAFFGYRVVVPPGWRRSTHPRLTRQTPGSPPTGHEIFTVRTIADEEQQVACCLVGSAPPPLAYTVMVQVVENPQRLSSDQWFGERYTANQVTRVTISGRAAIRAKDSPVGLAPGATGIWVARDEVIFKVTPQQYDPRWLPVGANEARLIEDCQNIVDSFEVTR